MTSNDNAPLTNRKILVLEDEFFISMTLERYLLSAGAAVVDCVGTLADAFNLIAKMKYDAAVLDIRLPDGESFGLAQDLTDQGCAVIFHSGHAEEALTKRIPTSYFCSKPCSADQLTDVTCTAIQNTTLDLAK